MSVRSVLVLLFRRIARIYFREIEVAGDVPAHDVGGRLFAANHVNGLVDPILVITQTPCEISPVAKSTLWKIPGLRFLLDAVSAVPIIRRRDVPGKSESDNEAVFARVAKHLTTHGNILIFPEGTSHNEPHLLELRSGAGRMLARAAAETDAKVSATPLTFQSVALEFDERDVFRSRALVLFGPVRSVAAMHGSDLAQEITDVIQADLSELLVEGASWEERVLVIRVAEMFANDAGDRSLASLNRVGRQIEASRRVLSKLSPADVKTIEDRLRAYGKKLDAEEFSDDRVARAGRAEHVAPAPDRAVRAALMIVTLPLALFATVIYWLPYQLPRFITKRLHGDPDTASTYKLGVGLVVYPVWALAAIVVAFVKLPVDRAVIAAVLLLVSPFAALAWLDRWDRLTGPTHILSSSEDQRERLVVLAKERAVLMRQLDTLRTAAEAAGAPPPT